MKEHTEVVVRNLGRVNTKIFKKFIKISYDCTKGITSCSRAAVGSPVEQFVMRELTGEMMKETTAIDSVNASMEWIRSNEDCVYPEVRVDNFLVNTGDLTLEKPESISEYQEKYGIELNPDQFYYCDGECLHEEMNPAGSENGFAEWLADEVNVKLADLNGA